MNYPNGYAEMTNLEFIYWETVIYYLTLGFDNTTSLNLAFDFIQTL